MLRFIDEVLFPGNVDKLKEFADAYIKEINLPFMSFGRVGHLTEERIKIFKRMGCISLSIGIESGNEHMRNDILNRHMTNKDIVESFKICNNHGIRTTAFNMIALPEEGRKEIFDTIEVNRGANPGLTSATFVYPFPGTPLRDYCLEKGYITENDPVIDHDRDTIIRNDKISKKELLGLQKTFVLYTLIPKWLYPILRLCESETSLGNLIYRILVRWFRDINFKKNDLRFSEVPDTRELSVLAAPPLGKF